MPWVAAREGLEYVEDKEDTENSERRKKERDEFLPERVEGLPRRDEVLKWYTDGAGWDPRPMSDYGDVFTMFRVSWPHLVGPFPF